MLHRFFAVALAVALFPWAQPCAAMSTRPAQPRHTGHGDDVARPGHDCCPPKKLDSGCCGIQVACAGPHTCADNSCLCAASNDAPAAPKPVAHVYVAALMPYSPSLRAALAVVTGSYIPPPLLRAPAPVPLRI